MKTSLNGKRFLCAREALVKEPYPDGKMGDDSPRWSIGYGALANHGPLTPRINAEEGWIMMEQRLVGYEDDVNRHTKGIPLMQSMFDALISLYWRSGAGKKEDLRTALRFGDVLGAADLFLTFDKNQGKPSPGHARRARLERELFLRGDYGELRWINVWETGDTRPELMKREAMPR